MFKRILTALVGIPIAVFLVTAGGFYFSAAVFVLTLVAWREYAKMVVSRDVRLYKLTSLLPALLLIFAASRGKAEWFLPILTLGVLAILFEGLYRHCWYAESDWLRHTSVSITALLYIGLLFAYLPLLREYPGERLSFMGLSFAKGELALWMALLGTWSSDTFAYFFGMAFGKHKFCSVSPKKSMEGAVAGFIFALGVTAGIAYCGLRTTLPAALLLGLTVAFCAPVGDLIESVLKRTLGAKDSGTFFPGHGGVLDRFDSLLFVVPTVYYVLTFLGV